MKAVVLLSGGIDSATCLGIAVERYGTDNVNALSVYYRQKHSKELLCAAALSEYYNVKHYNIDMNNVFRLCDNSLLHGSTESIIHKSYAEQIAENGEGRVGTYVSFRNGLFLSACAVVADSLYPKQQVKIYYGAHADDAAGRAYADCSPEFADAMANAILIGTYGNVTLKRPLIGMTKKHVVAEGLRLDVPYHLTWSCYEGGDTPCGTCGTCIDRKDAFMQNGVVDPIQYKNA